MAKELFVRIMDINEKGYGIAMVGNKVIEVPGALPDEYVYVRIGRKRRAKIIRFLERSPLRQTPVCAYSGLCGGCLWQDVKYDMQLRIKQGIVERVFGFIKYDFQLEKIIPSRKIYWYRGKMEFIVGGESGSVVIGLRELGRYNRVVDIYSCWLQRPVANHVLQGFREKISILGYKPYNIITHAGFLRYAVLRVSHHTDECMVTIITSSKGKLDLSFIVDDLPVKTAVWAVSDSLADVAMGDIREVIGSGYIVENALGFNFKVPPFVFYQSNPEQAEILFDLAKRFGGSGDKALDLYCGIGTIAIIISENYGEVVGIEMDEDSVKVAYENARVNDVKNVIFIKGKVEERIGGVRGKIDTVFVDPPRPGLSKTVVYSIGRLAPSIIIYVSCNPRSQARDILELEKYGYRLELLQPVDMLPHTPHIETIAVLSKQR